MAGGSSTKDQRDPGDKDLRGGSDTHPAETRQALDMKEVKEALQDVEQHSDLGRDDVRTQVTSREMQVHEVIFLLDYRLQKQVEAVDEQLKALEESVKQGIPGQAFLQQTNLNFSRHEIKFVIGEVSEVETFGDLTNETFKNIVIERATQYVALIDNYVSAEGESTEEQASNIPDDATFVDCSAYFISLCLRLNVLLIIFIQL